MFPRIGMTELIIVLAIVVLLFGVGRISKIAGEMGRGIKSFREGLAGKDKDKDQEYPTVDDESKN